MPSTSPPELRHYPANRTMRLRNLNCAYCNCDLVAAAHVDEDHVIGRRFVPRGTLHGAWNLILRVCRPCNAEKAELEDDISAITMHPDAFGRFACDDERLKAEAARKAANSISRKTRKRVGESQGSMTIRGQLGPMNMTMNFVSRPQVDDQRMFHLALRQLQGFFFFQTYDETARRGHFWIGDYYAHAIAHKEDWGRGRLKWFMQKTADWDIRWHCVTADGFYKALIRKHPKHRLWSWALEWNQGYRLTGFFGDRDGMIDVQGDLPQERVESMGDTGKGHLRMRFEIPLAPDDDILFPAFDEGSEEPAKGVSGP